jgi:hypothetical protein
MDGIVVEESRAVSEREASEFLERFLATHHTQDVENPAAKQRVQVRGVGCVSQSTSGGARCQTTVTTSRCLEWSLPRASEPVTSACVFALYALRPSLSDLAGARFAHRGAAHGHHGRGRCQAQRSRLIVEPGINAGATSQRSGERCSLTSLCLNCEKRNIKIERKK